MTGAGILRRDVDKECIVDQAVRFQTLLVFCMRWTATRSVPKTLHRDGRTARAINPGRLFRFERVPLSGLAEPLVLTSDYTRQDRGYAHSSGAGVAVRVHPDPRLQMRVEQIREWSMVQAIDRIRLFDAARTGAVFVFSNVPLPLKVDHLVNEADLLPEWHNIAARLGGLLVNSAAELSRRLPGVFRDRKAADDWLRRWVLPGYRVCPRGIYGQNRCLVSQTAAISFRPPAKRRGPVGGLRSNDRLSTLGTYVR